MKSLITLFFIILNIHLSAQTATISGVINDAGNDEPIYAANVVVKGTTTGTTTDFDGKFTLTVPAGDITVVFSYIGYEKQETRVSLSAGQNKVFSIKLVETQMLLDQVVVTGSKFEKKLGEETVSLEIIRPSAIENLGFNQADEAIERAPGVTIVDGQANIRGGSGYSYGAGSRVLLLVDDIPSFQADAGRPNWSHIAVENIGQIEIIKGASSALYGSSAMNGIINVRTAYPTSKPYNKISFFTNQYNKPRTSKNLSGEEVTGDDKAWWKRDELIVGSDTLDISNTPRPREVGFSYAHRQKFGQHDLVIGAFVASTQDWRFGSYNNRLRINPNYRYRFKKKEGMSVGLNVNYQYGNSSSFFLYGETEADFYTPGAVSGLPTKTVGQRASVDPYFLSIDEKGNQHKLNGRYYYTGNDNEPYLERGPADTIDQDNFSHLIYGEYQYQKRFNKIEKIGLVLTTGAVGSYTISRAALFGDGDQLVLNGSNIAIYAQADFKFFGKLNVVAGGRLESNSISFSKTETKPVFRLGLNYQAAKYTYIRASFGQGYRFPTIAEKFISTAVGSIVIGQNLDLTSETGISAEIAVKQGVKLGRNINALLDASFFYSQYEDMMEFGLVSLEPITFQSRNVGNTRIYGTEVTLAGEGKIGNFPSGLMFGYNYIIPKFIEWDTTAVAIGEMPNEGQDNVAGSSSSYNILKYRFRHTFTADYFINFNGLELGVSARYFSFMENIDNVFETFLPGIKEYRANKIKDLQGETVEEKLEQVSKIEGPKEVKGDFIMDARMSYAFGKNNEAKIAFIVKNILNHEYSLRPGIMEAPRTYTIRLDVTF